MTPRDAGIKMKFIDYKHVDVMINGKVLAEGRMIAKEHAVQLLQGFAQKFGSVFVETEQLNGRNERDIIHPDGTVEPFYNVAGATQNVQTVVNTSLIDSLERAVATGVVEDQVVEKAKPRPSMSATLDYLDVEKEIARLAAAGTAGDSTEGFSLSSIRPWVYVAAAALVGVLIFLIA